MNECRFQFAGRWLAVFLSFCGMAVLFAREVVPAIEPQVTASSYQPGHSPAAAIDGDRFSVGEGAGWISAPGETRSWWQIDFGHQRRIGALLQIVGTHTFVFENAPTHYVWRGSRDGLVWEDLPGARGDQESRMYRLHRLQRAQEVRFLRLEIASCQGVASCLREVEFYDNPRVAPIFPEWVVAVNVTHDGRLPGHGREFIPLAQRCDPRIQAQQVWLTDFTPEFLAVEPRPLAAFLSGSFKDWCEVDRTHWRGVQRVLREARTPLWASCGGAQGLAIVAENGVDAPWDCPHCRDPRHPKLPIYGHIGHQHPGDAHSCGDYSDCVFERGPHRIRAVLPDPVFSGLDAEFEAMESHCGQIEFAPKGWRVIAVGGQGTKTRNQCLRLDGRPIYAAQFHIEMDGTPETSRSIMHGFLGLARDWQRPRGLLRGR